MNAERATEIIRQAAQWPYCGNSSRFMTEEERAEINRLWLEASDMNGNLSRNSILSRIARGADPLTGEQ